MINTFICCLKEKAHSGAGIALAALSMYLLFPSKEFYWDGIGFARVIESAQSVADLFNPNHLVYNVAGWLFWKVLTVSGWNLRALYTLQTMNALLAAASVYLLWNICKTLTGSVRESDCWAIVFAFSATWWRFAADANAYIAATFFLLLSFKLLVRTPGPNPYLVALTHSAAMIFHELALLFLPVAVAGLMLSAQDSANRWGRTKRLAKYGLTIAAIVGSAYAFAFFVTHAAYGWVEFCKWITVHSPDSSFSYDFLHNLRYSLRGMVRLFLGGRFTWLQANPVTLGAAILFCFCSAVIVRAQLRARPASHAAIEAVPKPFIKSKRQLVLLVLWCASFSIFLFFWLPQNTFYRLLYLPALILLLAYAWHWRVSGNSAYVTHSPRLGQAPRQTALLLLGALTVCMSNFAFLIYPLSMIQTNEILAFALQHQRYWTSSSRIAFGEYHTDLWTISYFNTQAKWEFLPASAATDPESFSREVEMQGKQLWLDGSAYDRIASTPEGRAWLSNRIDSTKSLLFINNAHQIRFYRVQ